MREILIISYVFPPGGGGGVQRTANFVKYLKKFNYRPIVLTVNKDMYISRGLPIDESLNEKVKNINIYRTSHFDVWKMSRLFSRLHLGVLLDSLLIPDYQIAWSFRAIEAGLRIIRKNKISVIYTTSPPNSTAIIGLLLKILSKKALVVDFRDPWTQCLSEKWIAKYRYKLEEIIERHTLSSADHIIANTPHSRTMLLNKFSDLNPDNITTINSGFDKTDFEKFISSYTNEKKHKMTILYAGYFYGEPPNKDEQEEVSLLKRIREKLKYKPEKVDMTTHSPYYFFKAISNLFDKKRLNPKNINIQFLGTIHQRFHHMVCDEPNLYKSVEFLDYQPHDIVLKYLQKADLLLFTLYKPLERPYLECIPGKTYEYMASKKPILALIPEGDAKKVLEKTGLAYFANPDNISQIEEIIITLYNYYQKQTIPISPQDDFVNQFNYYHITKKLTDVFNNILK